MSVMMNTTLSFVELTVRDLDAAVTWYREVMGLREVMRSEANSFALLSAGAAKLALKQGTPVSSSVLLAFEVADLDRWVRDLAERGVPLDGEVKSSQEGYRRARVRDRDGYAVSVFEWKKDLPQRRKDAKEDHREKTRE